MKEKLEKILGMPIIVDEDIPEGEAALVSIDVEVSTKEGKTVGDIIYTASLVVDTTYITNLGVI